jgi:hypothetical protein
VAHSPLVAAALVRPAANRSAGAVRVPFRVVTRAQPTWATRALQTPVLQAARALQTPVLQVARALQVQVFQVARALQVQVLQVARALQAPVLQVARALRARALQAAQVTARVPVALVSQPSVVTVSFAAARSATTATP